MLRRVAVLTALGVLAACGGPAGPGGPAAHGQPARVVQRAAARPTEPTEGGLPTPPPPQLSGVVLRIRTSQPVVYVGIDDGWSRDPSAAVLLDRRHAPVAMFLIGRAARRDPGYFAGIARATGGTVEDHTVSHPLLSRLGYRAQLGQICGQADLARALFGRRPVLVRPPYGAYDADTVRAARACRMRAVVLWDVEIRRGRLSRRWPGPISAGDIVLLHFTPHLATDLQALFAALDRHGLHVAGLAGAL